MRRDTAIAQRCAGLGRFTDVLVEDIFEARSGHRLGVGVPGSKKVRAPQGAAKLFITYLRNEGVFPPAHIPSREQT